ncbi:RNA methyltransferase [Prosthecomicrobium hirschii]|uniref:RNA methyltransferase n=1 Tax=Prosthecodimorpha hirschii TaxID=665126 RepID=A0A0P6W4K2_9HYPH|nr:RNA methyltransferase [Prosthecomicrobium hirschii]KPL54172.1 RNA methyltransferase [Prosthecomicrobium hirschii]
MPPLIPIDDPDDPRIAAFRDIRERDLVRRDHLFVAEGEVVLNVLARSPLCRPTTLLLLDSRVAALAPLLDALAEDVPVHVAPRTVIDRIVGFPLHRGILALGRRVETPTPNDLLARLSTTRARVLVLVGIANHDNMGGILRNAAAFGADAVLIDHASCDPLYRKAIRVSVGGALVVPFARLEVGRDPVELVRAAGLEPVALTPSGAETLADLPDLPRAALLFGTEGPGLPAATIARCRGIRIPMAGGFDSLNVATTSGIVLHHLAEQKSPR